jgi:hypothetical protein
MSSVEEEVVNELLYLLTGCFPSLDSANRRRWVPDQTGVFSVRSAYILLQSRDVSLALDNHVLEALQQLWMSEVSSKVGIFGWRLLLYIETSN